MRRRARAVRVLVVSAFNRDEFVVSALRSGAVGYVLKGADPDALLQAVDEVSGGGFYVSAQVSGSAQCRAADAAPGAFELLTKRQREVFRLMAQGLSRREIGDRLFISVRTVEDHRLKVTHKLGLVTQTDVVLFALRHGILSLDDAAGAPRQGP